MKTKIILLLLSILPCAFVHAQKISAAKVPPAVMKAFQAKFPDAQKVSWELEDKKEYEASFTSKGLEQSSSFDLQGRWMETGVEIKFSALPQTIQQTVNKEYSGCKIGEVCKAESARYGFCYEVEVVKDKQRIEIIFTLAGKILFTENGAEEN